jgi:hypothetical protein
VIGYERLSRMENFRRPGVGECAAWSRRLSLAEPIGVVVGCNPYAGSSDPFIRLNPARFFAPSLGSIGMESVINFL